MKSTPDEVTTDEQTKFISGYIYDILRSSNDYCMHYCGRKGIWFIYDILSLTMNTVCTIAGGREYGSYMTYSV